MTAWRAIVVLAVVVGCSTGETEDEPTSVPTATTASVAPTVAATSLAPAPTSLAPSPTATTVAGVRPEGFAAERAEITAADGTVCEVCLWVAATPEQRSRGLMGVTDLGGADGMVFVFEGPSNGAFWMRDTPTPLSIGFFAADGAYVSDVDMAPCLGGNPADCPRYSAGGPYASAIEVPAGGLGALGVGVGSRLTLLGTPCDPAET